MALTETAAFYVEMRLKDGVSQGLSRTSAKVKALSLDTSRLNSGLSKIGQGLKTGLVRGAVLGAGAVAFLAANLKAGIDSLSELEQVQAATNAVLRSTKGIAGQTAQSIGDLASKYEDLTTVDDKVIQRGENVLLTFTNIRKKAFEPALLAALNLSKGMGQSLNSSIVQIGKALNDPIKGITALTRVGVTFTDAQKKKIKTLVDEGKLYDAQKLVLAELNREFGGQAVAAADTYAGAQARLKDAVEGLQQALAETLMPWLTRVAVKLSKFLKDPAVVKRVQDLGQTIAGLFSDKNIDAGVSGVRKFFDYLKDLPWGTIKDGLKQSAQAAQTAVDIFKGLPPDLQKGLIGLLAVNKLSNGVVASGIGELVKFTLGSLKTIYATQVTVIGPQTGVPGQTPGVVSAGVPEGMSALMKLFWATALATSVTSSDNPAINSPYPGMTQRLSNIDKRLQELKDSTNSNDQSTISILTQERDALLAGNVTLADKLVGIDASLDPLVQIVANTSGLPSAIAQGSSRGGPNDPVAHMWTPVTLDPAAQRALDDAAASTRRQNYLSERIAQADRDGNDRRVARLSQKLAELASTGQGTTSAVKGNTGVLKDKNFAPTIVNNIRTQFNVSAVAVATSIQRVVLGHKVGFQ